MKKTLCFSVLLAAALSGRANSLLTSPVGGALGHSRISAMGMASNGTDVVLLLSDNTSLYALDIKDNNPIEVASNAITSIPDFVNAKLKPVAGGAAITIIDMEVNPISKSVYVLAEAAGTSYVFKVKKDGASISLLDLSDISHSTISWGSTFSVNDITWGNNKLYVSSGGFSLNGSVATITAPFAHGGTISNKATSMFKSNWGGSYFTSAPLETMTYGKVKTKERLMGVTTCAPGFSLDVAGLASSGTLQVNEEFNINMGVSEKVVFQRHDGKDWLFDLHDSKLYRIGESLIDGSPTASGDFNSAAISLRTNTGAPVAGISGDVFRQASGSYRSIAFWDDYRLVVLEAGGTLRMMQTAATAPGLSVDEAKSAARINVHPNPASGSVQVSLADGVAATLQVYGMDGRLLRTQASAGANTVLDISGLAAGQYLIKALTADGKSGQQVFLVQ